LKTVLINGGSRGIGRECVRLFSREGWRVAFTYKSSESEAAALAKECSALAIKADSANEQDVRRAVKEAREYLGNIYCLVNNAAISSFSLFTDITLDMWNEMLSVNLTGAFLYCREAAPQMINGKQGRIINISSMWGICGASCEVHYSAAKAGLIGFTKALAKELGPSGITVNAVAPGVINTDMNKSLSPSDMEALCEETPLSRTGEPNEVASAVLFLAGDGASFITGEVMNVSGGYIV